MSLENLENEITSAAQKEISGIESHASEEAERIVSEAKSKARERLAAESALLEREYSAAFEEAKSSLQITANSEIAKCISSAAERNYRHVRHLAEKEVLKNYGKFVKAALAKAEPLFKGAEGDVVVEASPKAAKELKHCRYELRKSKVEGIVIRSKDGGICIDSTISGAIDAHSDAIRNLLMMRFRTIATPLISEIRSEKAAAAVTKTRVRKTAAKRRQKAPPKGRKGSRKRKRR
jgi:vacuolar-type H+-ATPase subunit E/Vma4